MSKTHNSIDAETIDFTATQCMGLRVTDEIEWMYQDGDRAASILVSTVLKWIELNKMHVTEDKLPFECDSLQWLDDNFEYATKAYFMEFYAIKELI